MTALNDDIEPLPIVQQGHFLSLRDSMVLAIPTAKACALTFRSVYSGNKIVTVVPSLFICANPDMIEGNRAQWFLHTITLARFTEFLATIDAARGNSSLCNSEKQNVVMSPWLEFIAIELADGVTEMSVDNVALDLMLRNHSEFNTWCELLRKYEAYGMMSFVLSSLSQRDNLNVGYLSQCYGVSAAYFRQLYRDNFKATVKKKIMSARMASAVLQLIESEGSILEVGLDAGYCSAAHFTNNLKKELGLTPSDIRRLESILYES